MRPELANFGRRYRRGRDLAGDCSVAVVLVCLFLAPVRPRRVYRSFGIPASPRETGPGTRELTATALGSWPGRAELEPRWRLLWGRRTTDGRVPQEGLNVTIEPIGATPTEAEHVHWPKLALQLSIIAAPGGLLAVAFHTRAAQRGGTSERIIAVLACDALSLTETIAWGPLRRSVGAEWSVCVYQATGRCDVCSTRVERRVRLRVQLVGAPQDPADSGESLGRVPGLPPAHRHVGGVSRVASRHGRASPGPPLRRRAPDVRVLTERRKCSEAAA